MNRTFRVIFIVLPFLTFTFTLWVVHEIVSGLQELNVYFFIFIFTLFEVYVNWIAIILLNTNIAKFPKQNFDNDITVKVHNDQVASVKLSGNSREMVKKQELYLSPADSNLINEFPLLSLNSNVAVQKIWFCPKCQLTTPQNCYHCSLCRKCVFLRDHHCFFLGACISKQNLSHFVVLCFYASVLSFSASVLIYFQLNIYFQNKSFDMQSWILARYFFPVSLGHWLSGAIPFHALTLVSIFDLCISLSISTLCFGLYYFHLVATGEMQSKLYNSHKAIDTYHNKSKKKFMRNLNLVFGDWWVVNLIFPITICCQFFSLKKFKLPILSNDDKYH